MFIVMENEKNPNWFYIIFIDCEYLLVNKYCFV